MIVVSILTVMLLSWQTGLARDRLAGQAALLADIVAREGYALHHWLHEAQAEAAFTTPDDRAARRLLATETTALTGHGAATFWQRLPRGWDITRLVSNPAGQADRQTRAHGIVVLQPEADVTTAPTWRALRAALQTQLGRTPRAAAAEGLAEGLLGEAFDPARDFAVFAYPYARIDPAAVLRMPRTGYSRPIMATGIDMDDNTLNGAARIGTATARLPELDALAMEGELTASAGLVVTGDSDIQALEAQAGEIQQALATPQIEAEDAAITGTVTLSGDDLLACRDVNADRCNGGDLDFTEATGAPRWDPLTIFGDGWVDTVKEITQVEAGTTVFDTLSGESLTVRNKFNCATCDWMFR